MERSKADTKGKRSPDGQNYTNQNTIIIKILVIYKRLKKYNEIELTKNKMDLSIRKIKNHPPSQ